MRAPWGALAMAGAATVSAVAGCSSADSDDPTESPSANTLPSASATASTEPTAAATAHPAALVRITDDSGQISMLAPAGWEVDGRPRYHDAQEVFMPSLVVSEDVNEFWASRGFHGSYYSSGVHVHLTPPDERSLDERVAEEASYWIFDCSETSSDLTWVDDHLYAAHGTLQCAGKGEASIDETSIAAVRSPDGVDAVVALRFADDVAGSALPSEVWASLEIASAPDTAPSPREVPVPDGFQVATDESGRISVAVPADWQIDPRPRVATEDGTYLSGVIAAPDIAAFLNSTDAPGVGITLMPDDQEPSLEVMTKEAEAQVEGEGEDCGLLEPSGTWDDGHLTGAYGEYGCHESMTVVRAGLSPNGTKAMITIRGTEQMWDADIPSQVYATITLGD